MSLKDRLTSIWEGTDLPKFQQLEESKVTEVCVVGGGIAGVSTAYQLAKRGFEVTLVEAYQLASGQTERTTAHLTTQLEEQFCELVRMHGKESTALFHNAHRSAINTIESICESENISCDFKRLSGYLFRGENFSELDLRQERKAAHDCGIELEFIAETPLLSESISSLKFENQAQFNPLKYISGLIRVLGELGVSIYEGTHIRKMNNFRPDITTLTTDHGHEIKAKHVVIATDTPISSRFSIHSKQFAYRTYAMAFHLSKTPQEEILLWDTEDPYHYVRFVGDSLVVGGGDHRTGQSPKEDPFEELENWSRKNFSFLRDLQWKWSGQVFEPTDQLPYIGKNPSLESNIFIITGASGIGMTTGTIGSLLISDLIEGKENIYSQLFDPSRTPFHKVGEYMMENVNVAYQYKDWITPNRIKRLKDIPEDSGSLFREGLTKNCVYHAEGENFETKSAICPHLGGIVHWNDIEKTWDCPCHGSRFNTKGEVIEGPSLSNLSER
jgi:glycine/D-amino acid oxidase-like deaminating enzyme/nitrite reductase/ring-hydroxylating ferredoxin subunit